MMIKNTKSFIEFCKEIGIIDIIGKEPSVKFIEKEPSIKFIEKKKIKKSNFSNEKIEKNEKILKNLEKTNKKQKLEELRLKISNLCCNLKDTATNLVLSDGNINSKIMFIGGAPRTEEDRTGIPFVGEGGKLLHNMLFHVGLTKLNCYFSNLIFWRPPGNRQPNNEEIQACLPLTKEHIEIIRPEIIILVGGLAANKILNMNDSITKIRGKEFMYSNKDRKIKTFVVFHPEFLIENITQKKKMWLDLTEIKKATRKIKYE